MAYIIYAESSITLYTPYNIYIQSNKIHNVVLMSKFYSALMLA